MRNIYRPIPYGIYYGFNMDIAEKINSLIKRIKPEVVQLCSLGLLPYGVFIPSGVPKIMVAADCLSLAMKRLIDKEANLFKKSHYLLNYFKSRHVERNSYPLFTYVVLVSDVDLNIIQNVSRRSKLALINLGVDTEYFCRSTKSLSNNLGIVGNFGYKPNERGALFLISDVFRSINKIYPDTKIYIVGVNPTRKILNCHNAENRIIITGYVEDVRYYYERIGIFVSYLDMGAGIKIKVLEAMSMCLPVVGSKIAFEGIDGKNGIHFLQAGTKIEAINIIERLLSDKPKMIEIGNNARKLVLNKYSWREKAKEYELLWEKCLSEYG